MSLPPECPLVSIVVITYNSAEYVLETLESAKAQTYQNIELIVSDDCSADNTVETCSRWQNVQLIFLPHQPQQQNLYHAHLL